MIKFQVKLREEAKEAKLKEEATLTETDERDVGGKCSSFCGVVVSRNALLSISSFPFSFHLKVASAKVSSYFVLLLVIPQFFF